MSKEEYLLLGAHVSISGGLHRSIERAKELACTTMQIFTRNNRQWSFDRLSDEEATLFKHAQQHSPIKIVISHSSYLINIASPDSIIRNRSLKALQAEIERCHQAQIPFVVLHPGACMRSTEVSCVKQIGIGLSEALQNTPQDVAILLENTAGQGSSIGHTLEQLAAIYDATTEKERLGFCFDTCHGFAAGYDFRTEELYIKFWKNFDKILGIKNLKALHLNDSKKEYNSRVDRHEDIGKGKIGIDAFRFIMQDRRFMAIPKIIETPMETMADHARNLEILRKIASTP